MGADAGFLRRLYAVSPRFVQQFNWERHWVVVAICPNRTMNFGPITPVREFVEQRLRWIELLPSDGQKPSEPLTQVLGLLVQTEAKVRAISDSLRQQAPTNPAAGEVLPLIPAILLARFNDRPIAEICAMGGLTLDDFTSSRAYREIFREGEARGEASVTLRQLNRRCAPLSLA